MPELPEVETYVRELEPLLRGRTVRRVAVSWPRTIAAPGVAEFEREMAGRRFTSFGRRGKYMLLGLEDGRTLIVHLRMTGRLLVAGSEFTPGPHIHVVFTLDEGERLLYQDARKFGRLWLVPEPATVLAKLGPEPLDKDAPADLLAARLGRRKAAVKTLLLDQAIVAGVGNIYADEALFRAGIHPLRPGASLSAGETERLWEAIRSVLAEGIAGRGSSLGGSDLQNYLPPSGGIGSYQEQHRVYGRAGEPCRVCGTPIVRVVLNQRSAHFCPHCQAGVYPLPTEPEGR
jgi:formamidopyrimidine-DNA glycosylase